MSAATAGLGYTGLIPHQKGENLWNIHISCHEQPAMQERRHYQNHFQCIVRLSSLRFVFVITLSKISSQNIFLHLANDLDKQIMQNKNNGRAISYIQHIVLYNIAIIQTQTACNRYFSTNLLQPCLCRVCGCWYLYAEACKAIKI